VAARGKRGKKKGAKKNIPSSGDNRGARRKRLFDSGQNYFEEGGKIRGLLVFDQRKTARKATRSASIQTGSSGPGRKARKLGQSLKRSREQQGGRAEVAGLLSQHKNEERDILQRLRRGKNKTSRRI